MATEISSIKRGALPRGFANHRHHADRPCFHLSTIARETLAPLDFISKHQTVHHEAFILLRAGNGAVDGGGT